MKLSGSLRKCTKKEENRGMVWKLEGVNILLGRPFSVEEIKHVFSIPLDKALGPDGFIVAFFSRVLGNRPA